MFNEQQIEQLSAKLDKSHVKEREQAGRKLSYIEGWHAIAEANRIFGYDAWTRETLDIRMVAEGPRKIGRPPNQRDGFGVSYIAKVRVIVCGVAREGIGAGHGVDADLGLAHESAIKEAETDAMKRALMTFGNPFGLALYDKTQENVEQPMSEAYKIALGAMKMCVSKQQLSDWWKANKANIGSSMPDSESLQLVKERDAFALTLPLAVQEAA